MVHKANCTAPSFFPDSERWTLKSRKKPLTSFSTCWTYCCYPFKVKCTTGRKYKSPPKLHFRFMFKFKHNPLGRCEKGNKLRPVNSVQIITALRVKLMVSVVARWAAARAHCRSGSTNSYFFRRQPELCLFRESHKQPSFLTVTCNQSKSYSAWTPNYSMCSLNIEPYLSLSTWVYLVGHPRERRRWNKWMVCKGSTSTLEHDPQATSALQYSVRECPSEHLSCFLVCWTSTLWLLRGIWLKN